MATLKFTILALAAVALFVPTLAIQATVLDQRKTLQDDFELIHSAAKEVGGLHRASFLEYEDERNTDDYGCVPNEITSMEMKMPKLTGAADKKREKAEKIAQRCKSECKSVFYPAYPGPPVDIGQPNSFGCLSNDDAKTSLVCRERCTARVKEYGCKDEKCCKDNNSKSMSTHLVDNCTMRAPSETDAGLCFIDDKLGNDITYFMIQDGKGIVCGGGNTADIDDDGTACTCCEDSCVPLFDPSTISSGAAATPGASIMNHGSVPEYPKFNLGSLPKDSTASGGNAQTSIMNHGSVPEYPKFNLGSLPKDSTASGATGCDTKRNGDDAEIGARDDNSQAYRTKIFENSRAGCRANCMHEPGGEEGCIDAFDKELRLQMPDMKCNFACKPEAGSPVPLFSDGFLPVPDTATLNPQLAAAADKPGVSAVKAELAERLGAMRGSGGETPGASGDREEPGANSEKYTGDPFDDF